ncbi:MAG: lamin tail domain-containing protein, partial [Planctomycetota bacterium]
MKMRIVVPLVSCLLLFVCAAHADLKVDFTQSGGPVQGGCQGYLAVHENSGTFTSQNYAAFGTTVSVTPSWPNTTDNRVQQCIDRGDNFDNSWDNSAGDLDLVTDWIGIDTRTGNGGNGDWNGSVGSPTYMLLTIGGLPAGDYLWTSFHHDTEHVYGPFAVWVSTDGGSSFTQLADGLMTDGTAGGNPDSQATEHGPDAYTLPSTYTTSFMANGTDDVVMRFAPYSAIAVHRQIWGMNAFVLRSQNPCFNVAPVVDGPETASVYVGETLFIDVEASDDGLPYIEGCNPEDPGTGTPYGLDYQWSQVSGPAPAQIDPLSGDVQDVNVGFQLPGTYELLLEVTDGPLGPAPEAGKRSEFRLTVEVIRTLDGDIDLTGTVDYHDLDILADQWLDECGQSGYCADLDGSGRVAGGDLALLSSNWRVQNTKVLINEFVASNRNSLMDGDGESSDWIELYNAGDEPVSLAGWFLTDNEGTPKKWPFPAGTVLGDGDYLVVFASNQEIDTYVDSKGYLHTNFAVEKSGGYLALVNPAGRVMHEYADYPPQERDISYGMWFSVFRYFALPTPEKANEQAFLGFTDKTSHSHSRGFYDEPFSLRIFCDTSDAVIRYTLDGSEPTEQHGTIYDASTPIMVTTTVHVRSVAFKAGLRPAKVTTHSYIFPDDVAHQPPDPPGWPSDWGYSSDARAVVPSDYEMDQRVVSTTLPGYSIRDALLDIPTVSISMNPADFISDATGIYANPQSRWERKCSIEYFFPDNTTGFQHDCKIEVHGNASRRPYRMQKHSLRLTFTSLYGPAKLNYPLFGESGVETFNQLVLRASFTDSWGLVSWSSSRYRPNDSQYIRDVWMKESLAAMGQPSSRGNFVHLYVNGLYFGIHNLTERLKGDFFADHLGGEPEHWEINEDLSSPDSRWNAMMAIDPATPAGYAQIQ